MTARVYDAVVVGGGHNGLVCAAYLAAAGLSVCVCERRQVVGGAAVTEEFHPGFRNSTASYTVSLLDPQVIRTEWQPRRAFQGWRYLPPKDAPRDLKDGSGGWQALPPDLRSELANLGLL